MTFQKGWNKNKNVTPKNKNVKAKIETVVETQNEVSTIIGDVAEKVETKPEEKQIEVQTNWKEKGRRNRRPMRLQRKLDFSPREGYHRRVVNDTDDGRVQRFKDAGYAIVMQENMEGYDDRLGAPHQMGTPVRVPVGQKKNGEALHGVLMEIPQEWYNEDHKIKQDKITQAEKERLKNPSLMKDGFYGKVEMGRE